MERAQDLGSTTHDLTATSEHRPSERSSARLIELLDPPSDFNFRHFRVRHMAAELIRTLHSDGVLPGQQAPNFDLATTRGERVLLCDLRGQPVLVHLVSYT